MAEAKLQEILAKLDEIPQLAASMADMGAVQTQQSGELRRHVEAIQNITDRLTRLEAQSASSASTDCRMETMLREIRRMQKNMVPDIIHQLQEGAVTPGRSTGRSGLGGTRPRCCATTSLRGKASLGRLSESGCPPDEDIAWLPQAAHAEQPVPDTHAQPPDGSVALALHGLEGGEDLNNPKHATRRLTEGDFAIRPTGSGSEAESFVDSCNVDFMPPTLPRDWPMSLGLRPGLERVLQRLQTAPPDNRQHTILASSLQFDSSSSTLHPDVPNKIYMLMPGSRRHVGWGLQTFLVLVCDLVTNPVILAWNVEVQGLLAVLSRLSVCCWTLDMVLSFFRGFYEAGELQTSPRVIAKQYLRTWFCFDMAILMSDWANIVVRAVDSTQGAKAGIVRILSILKIGRFLRTLRVFRVMRFIRVFLEKQMSGFATVVMCCFWFMLGTGLLMHLMCCFWYMLGRTASTHTGQRWTDMFEADGHPAHAEALHSYRVSFHWAAAQLTLGATDVNSTNSLERAFDVLCMLIGLLYSCTLVSSLSATMVKMQTSQQERRQKMATLLEYFNDSMITHGTRIMVQEQVTARLHEPTRNSDSEASPLLDLLSSSLYAQLRLEVLGACISSHPLLTICRVAHPLTVQRLCRAAMGFEHLQTDDELFEAGQVVNQAYYPVRGQLQYTRSPDSAAVTTRIESTVDEGEWLCQAALWGEWVTVGGAVAKTRCKLVVLESEPFLEILSRHHLIETVVAGYAKAFHNQLRMARPSVSKFPTDLEVPNTLLEEVAADMCHQAQLEMSLLAIHCAKPALRGSTIRKSVGRRPSFRFGSGPRLNLLEAEVHSRQCMVFLNQSHKLERIVVATKVRIMNSRDQILVEMGTRDKCGQITSTFKLPGTKMTRYEERREAFEQILDRDIPKLAGNVEFLSKEKDIKKEFSDRFNMSTTYISSVCHAKITQQCHQNLGSKGYCIGFNVAKSPGTAIQLDTKGELLSTLRHAIFYKAEDSDGKDRLYCWLCPTIFTPASKALNHDAMAELLKFVFVKMDAIHLDEDDASGSDDSDHTDTLKI